MKDRRHDATGRSTGRHLPSKGSKIEGPFSPRLIEMMESLPFRALSLSGRRILDRLEIELARHGGKDNGSLPCTFEDFTEYGIDRHAVRPALNEVEALGFVERTHKGKAGNAGHRSASLYRLTYRVMDRAAPTHEWREITTVDEVRERQRVARMTDAVVEKRAKQAAKRDGAAT